MADLHAGIDNFFSRQRDILAWGVAPPAPIEQPEKFKAWLAAGKHGEMTYLENNLTMRLTPQEFFPPAESVVLFLHRWPEPIRPAELAGQAQVSAYACGPDYHHVMKALMRELEQTLLEQDPTLALKMFVDSAPVMERDLAVRAGLGWIGKNGLLLHPQRGSQFFIGGFFINKPVAGGLPTLPDRCGSCRRCIESCPTAAIEGPRQINASRCISYLTIEKKGEIAAELREKIGNRIFGCDICQQVCPWNQKHLAGAPPPASKFHRSLDDWRLILQPGGGFKRLFKQTPLYRAGRGRMLRNVGIALENDSEEKF